MSITVSLDPKANPPVTVSPATYIVSAKGTSQIVWMPAANQTFTFVSLTFASNVRVFGAAAGGAGGGFYVNDTNGIDTPTTDYPYTLVVAQNGVNYSTATSGPSATKGAPTIRNN